MSSYFSHLPPTGPAPTANEIYLTYRRAFLQQISDGVRRPLVFPYNFLSPFILIVYLCIPHKQNPVIYAFRWPIVGLITWFEFCAIQQVSGTGPSMGFMGGMQSAFIILWAWTWLVFKRPQWDAKRVDKRRVRVIKDVKKAQLSEKNAVQEELGSDRLATDTALAPNVDCFHDTYEFYWQSYPDNFKERMFWVLDLLLSYRGPGWDWSVPIVRKLTPETLNKLANPSENGVENGVENGADSSGCSAAKKCSRSSCCEKFRGIFLFVFGYLLLDGVWFLMMQDPYFKFGPTTYELPSHLKSLNPQVLYLYRMTLVGFMIITSMRTFYAAGNTFMAYVLGPKILGLRGEPWYYNQVWGSFSKVFDRGLGGLWGNFWHQTFRNVFTAPTTFLIQKGCIKPGKFGTKLVGLAFAFILSGFIHWAAQVTAFGDTYPMHELLFYGLQGVGVALQNGLSKAFSPWIVKLPSSIRKIGNLFFTLGWFYLTAWIEADNLGRSGLLVVLPIPFSPLLYFGFGEQDTSWNCWKSTAFLWYSGKNYFDSGYFFA